MGGHLTFYGKSRTTILESFIFIDFFYMPFHFFTILGITILQCSIAHEIQLPFNSAFRLTYASKAHAANSEGATNFSQGATCFLHAHVLLVSLFHLLQGVPYCFVLILMTLKNRGKKGYCFKKSSCGKFGRCYQFFSGGNMFSTCTCFAGKSISSSTGCLILLCTKFVDSEK